MRIIDLLKKIENGEEVPKRIRIDHWCYKFEWIEHQSNYYDKHNEIDLMSCLSSDKEELNYEVHEIEEEKKIPEKLEEPRFNKGRYYIKDINGDDSEISGIERTFRLKINEIIDYLKSKGDE